MARCTEIIHRIIVGFVWFCVVLCSTDLSPRTHVIVLVCTYVPIVVQVHDFRGEEFLEELATRLGLHPNQLQVRCNAGIAGAVEHSRMLHTCVIVAGVID